MLLNQKPSLRMGSGYNGLKNHQYFEEIEWDELMTRRLPIKGAPKLNNLEAEKSIALK